MSRSRDLVRDVHISSEPSAVYWVECTEADVPGDDLWLTENERLRLSSLKIPKRRLDWRLGRWTAKSAVCALRRLGGRYLSFPDVEIQVSPSGAPHAYACGAIVNISLTHRNGTAMCVVSRSGLALGCDLELIEPRSRGFLSDYFTTEEQLCIQNAPDEISAQTLAALFWSAKESALKALHVGLRMPISQLAVHVDSIEHSVQHFAASTSCHWRPLRVDVRNNGTLHGWWSARAPFIRTVVAQEFSACPCLLHRTALS